MANLSIMIGWLHDLEAYFCIQGNQLWYDPVPPADWARYKTDLCRKLMPYAEASQAA